MFPKLCVPKLLTFSIRTALAEAELEYDNNFISPSVYVRFPMDVIPSPIARSHSNQKVYALIWTTTPWTLPSNQAICYNSNLEYSLVQMHSSDKELYVIASNLVEDFVKMSKIECSVKQTFAGKRCLRKSKT